MASYARIAAGQVVEIVEIADGTPRLSDRYHPTVLATFLPLSPTDAARVQLGWQHDGMTFAPPTPPPPPVPMPRYVTVPTIRERMEASGTWVALVAILQQDQATMLKVLTLRDGIDSDDPQARALIAAAGDDPDAVLAP